MSEPLIDQEEEVIHYHKNPMDHWCSSLFYWTGTGLEVITPSLAVNPQFS